MSTWKNHNNDQLCLVQALTRVNGPVRKLLVVTRKLFYNWLDTRDDITVTTHSQRVVLVFSASGTVLGMQDIQSESQVLNLKDSIKERETRQMLLISVLLRSVL